MIDDVFVNRMFAKFDKLEDKLDVTCDRVTRIEEKQDAHFADLENKKQNRERKFYIVIAIIGVLFTVRELI